MEGECGVGVGVGFGRGEKGAGARSGDASWTGGSGTRRHAPTARCGVFSGVLSGVTYSATLSARDPRDDALSTSWIL